MIELHVRYAVRASQAPQTGQVCGTQPERSSGVIVFQVTSRLAKEWECSAQILLRKSLFPNHPSQRT
jgi:hypothetical protein